MIRYAAAWLSVAAAIGAALWLRLNWIEATQTARHCLAGHQSLGCDARAWAIAAFSSGGLEIAAIASAVLALLWKQPLIAWLAALCGGVAMILYSPDAGAATLLVGVLRLARLNADARARPRHQHRRGQQQVA